MEIHAKEQAGLGDGWHIASFEWVDRDILIGMCQCPLTAKGKRAGQPNYRKSTDRRKVVLRDHAKWLHDYLAARGMCQSCYGEGRKLKRWNHITGTEWLTCAACEGTGKTSKEL